MELRLLMTQSGHERAAFAAVHGPDLLYLGQFGRVVFGPLPNNA